MNDVANVEQELTRSCYPVVIELLTSCYYSGDCCFIVYFCSRLMKNRRTFLYIGASTIALLFLLGIQVIWIWRSAENREELFNEKAEMVLAKTADALKRDLDKDSTMTNLDRTKVDSLIRSYMKLYNLPVGYHFELSRENTPAQVGSLDKGFPLDQTKNSGYEEKKEEQQPGCYTTCIGDKPGEAGIDLKLVLPDKKQLILEEIRIPIIASVILVILVLFLYWRTTLSLLREKIVAEHTTEFLNNMTHELKTPLTNIALAGKMLLRNHPANSTGNQFNYAEIILQENEKLKEQVEHVLSMSALERGDFHLQKSNIDLHSLIQEVIQALQIQCEDRDGSIELHLNATKTLLQGDSIHLRNAFRNLIENALKYSPEKPTITLLTRDVTNNIVVSISDQGIGIPKKYQKRVFDSFFRVPTGDIHTVKGFGLGLSYAKQIVTLHRGTIHLTSTPGKGTTLTIQLPLS